MKTVFTFKAWPWLFLSSSTSPGAPETPIPRCSRRSWDSIHRYFSEPELLVNRQRSHPQGPGRDGLCTLTVRVTRGCRELTSSSSLPSSTADPPRGPLSPGEGALSTGCRGHFSCTAVREKQSMLAPFPGSRPGCQPLLSYISPSFTPPFFTAIL